MGVRQRCVSYSRAYLPFYTVEDNGAQFLLVILILIDNSVFHIIHMQISFPNA